MAACAAPYRNPSVMIERVLISDKAGQYGGYNLRVSPLQE